MARNRTMIDQEQWTGRQEQFVLVWPSSGTMVELNQIWLKFSLV